MKFKKTQIIVDTIKISCPICRSDVHCRATIGDGDGKRLLCINCGYYTHSSYKVGSDELLKMSKFVPPLFEYLQIVDSENTVWFPVILMGSDGMLMPGIKRDSDESVFDWEWLYVKFNGEMFDVDENTKYYSKDNFYYACLDLGFIKETVN